MCLATLCNLINQHLVPHIYLHDFLITTQDKPDISFQVPSFKTSLGGLGHKFSDFSHYVAFLYKITHYMHFPEIQKPRPTAQLYFTSICEEIQGKYQMLWVNCCKTIIYAQVWCCSTKTNRQPNQRPCPFPLTGSLAHHIPVCQTWNCTTLQKGNVTLFVPMHHITTQAPDQPLPFKLH